MFNKKKEKPVQDEQFQQEESSIDFGTTVPDQSDDLDFDFEDDESTPDLIPETYEEEQTYEEQTSYQEEPVEEQVQVQEEQQKVAPQADKKMQDIVLHIIIDKSTADMLDYFRSYGVNVSRIFNNIEEAKNEILMQINPCRIVIVDTGTGRFSLMGARKALIDLLGIGDEDNKISVFYTDSVIKEDISLAEEVDNKQIDWIKYRSTADILATLLQKKKKENYIIDDTLEEVRKQSTPEELMNFKGLSTNEEMINLGQPTFSVTDIAMSREEGSGNEQLQAYEVKY